MKKIFFLFFLCTSYLVVSSFRHPYHVGSVEINHNKKTKTFEITGRFFIDDLENALNKKYGTSSHFNEENYKNQLNDALRKYALEYFKLKVNNQLIRVKYVGYEEDHESVNLYLETEVVSQPKKIEVAASFLYNLYDDQMNMVHVIVNGNRKSSKLSYPNRYLYQNF